MSIYQQIIGKMISCTPLLRFYGARSLKVAMSYHLVARAFSCKGDFRTALQHEKEAFGIYKQLVNIHFLFPVKQLSDHL